jgi:hypothetical protein
MATRRRKPGRGFGLPAEYGEGTGLEGEKWRGRGERRFRLEGEYGRGGRLEFGVKGREGCEYGTPPGPERRGEERLRGGFEGRD